MTVWFRIAFTWWWVVSYLGYSKVHFMLIKYTCDSKSQTLRMCYPSQSTAERFQTETGGRFAFTRCRCEILNRSEILAPVQQPGWYHAGVTRAGMTFCGCIMLTLKYRAMRGSRSELAPAWKSPECNVNTTLVSLLVFFDELLLYSAPIIIQDSQRVNRKTKKKQSILTLKIIWH